MQRLADGLRVSAAGLLAALLMLGAQALAQDEAPSVVALEPWQGVITSQIEAFRAKDAPGAFQYAGSGFQRVFSSAQVFFDTIISAGYAPIMESRSHSFGRFMMFGDKAVLQEVRLVGNDQTLYEAFYQLTEEADGWRVQGVQLLKRSGVGI